ncbi:hypothetical protein LUZ60_010501 [Juncus effusus]|nr:hypothetical protein LUZ60_010501 [Juncus effusus]
MAHKFLPNSLSLCLFFLIYFSTSNSLETKDLIVGDELKRETLPLNNGESIYKIIGLKDYNWYEVKISYPASIPASFSIELKGDETNQRLNTNRRLLNTEKIIFKSENNQPVYVVVSVNAEGVVAQPNVQERELVLFNIACDELMLGVPRFAWWLGSTAILCLLFALIFPYFFPFDWLLSSEKSMHLGLVKDS